MKYILSMMLLSCCLTQHAHADFKKGESAYRVKDYKTAILEWKKSASLGDVKSLIRLGTAYYEGEGVSKDFSKAFKYYALAAEKGSTGAQYLVGLMYDKGDGVAVNHKEAVRWYLLSAENGFAIAQLKMGLIYEGVERRTEKNYEKSLMWYKKAAEQGNKEAQGQLGMMYILGKGTPKNIDEGKKWIFLSKKK